MRLGFVGGGVMGEALVRGLLERRIADASAVTVADISGERRQHLASTYGVSVTDRAADAASGTDLVVYAVKPQEFAAAAEATHDALGGGPTVLSIMAGVALETLQQRLGTPKVARAMPNTPAQVGEGMSVWTAAPEVPAQAREAIGRLLGALGREIYVPEEKYVEMATAVSASGPGFFFLLLEALVDAAVHLGFRRDVASELVLQTALGSVRFAQESGRHLAELRNQVTSPGGTTAAGLLALERAGVRAALMEAVAAAYARARALEG